MTCGLCGTGDSRPGTTTMTFTRGEMTIVVRNVPALVCDDCGHATLTAAIAEELEQLVAGALAAGVKYEVRDYVAAA
jgi:YgiT-type zinc finger domain-containing protein